MLMTFSMHEKGEWLRNFFPSCNAPGQNCICFSARARTNMCFHPQVILVTYNIQSQLSQFFFPLLVTFGWAGQAEMEDVYPFPVEEN